MRQQRDCNLHHYHVIRTSGALVVADQRSYHSDSHLPHEFLAFMLGVGGYELRCPMRAS
jgi:hypothetical protein